MSKLLSLSIKGVRSFSPSNQNEIEFTTPLTLIIGANGTGKTTIIECLKFATTGEMPPNSRGGAFIYDPKMTNDTDVRAEIELILENNSGESMKMTKTLSSTLKKIKMEQRTLDCVFKNLNTNKILGNKIAEIDLLVPENLGVNASILQNVIFCHQEESTWPLSEPANMKKKLDDIFCSTKYNKALLSLKATKKEVLSDIKMKSQEVLYLYKDKTKKDQKLNLKISKEEELSQKEKKLNSFVEERERLSSVIESLKIDLNKMEKSENEYRILKIEFEKYKKEIEDFKGERIALPKDFEKNNIYVEEKNYEKNNNIFLEEKNYENDSIFEDNFSSKENTNNIVQNNINEIQRVYMAYLKKYHSKVLLEMEDLRLKVESMNLEKIEFEYAKICKIREFNLKNKLKIEKIQKSIEGEETNKMDCERNKLDILNVLTKQFKCKEEEIEEKMKITFDSVEKKIFERQEDLNKRMGELAIAKNDAIALEEKIRKNEEYISENCNIFVENYDIDFLREQLLKFSEIDYQGKKILDSKLEKLNLEYQNILQEKCKKSEIDFKIEDLKSRILIIDEKIQNNFENTNDLIKNNFETTSFNQNNFIPADGFKQNNFENTDELIQNNLNFLIKKIDSSKKLLKEMNNEIKEIANNSQKVSTLISQAESSEKEIKKIWKFLGLNETSALMTEIATIEPLRSDHLQYSLDVISSSIAEITNSAAIYKNFQKIGESTDECPLCHSNLCDKKDDFIRRMEFEIVGIPAKLLALQKEKESVELEIKEISDKNFDIHKNIEKILGLRALYVSILQNILNSSGLNETEYILNGFIIKLPNFSEILSENSVMQKKKESEIEFLREEIIRDSNSLTKIQSLNSELLKLKKELVFLESKNYSSISFEGMPFIKISIKETREKIKEKENEILNQEKIKSKLEENLKNLEIFKKVEKFRTENSEFQKIDFSEMENQIYLDKIKINSKNTAFMNARAEALTKFNSYKNFTQKIKISESKINSLKESLNFENQNSEISVDYSIFPKIDHQGDFISDSSFDAFRKFVDDRKSLFIKTNKLYEIKNNLIKNIENNVKLIKSEHKLCKIEKLMSKIDLGFLEKTKEMIRSNTERFNKTLACENVLKGEIKQMYSAIETIEDEIQNNFKDISEKYSTALIQLKILEIGSDDLDKCISGLDKAIVEYHSSKIEEVNSYLRDLWTNTYKGNDIDYIELKSESSDAKSYNYRIIMVKNGVELNMRGRSSTGQKMVASILIRLALSESFSTTCKILALDEPTTNLDRENVESLAQTLSNLINERKDVQLIIITHDQEFVQMLNRCGTEYYYRLERNSRGSSMIEKKSIYDS